MAGYRVFEVNGYIWDYGKIADTMSPIADQFLQKIGIDDSGQRDSVVYKFASDIRRMQYTALENTRFPDAYGIRAPFSMNFSTTDSNPYFYDKEGRIVDHMGDAVPQDLAMDNYVRLGFHQWKSRNALIRGTVIERLNAEDVMEFAEEATKMHEGLYLAIGIDQVPMPERNNFIASVAFDDTYKIGEGTIKVRLSEYET